MDSVLNFAVAAVLAGAPLLFGTLGEILTEKSGNLNLGVEGMMFMGGIGGLAGAVLYERAVATPIPMVSVLVAVVCAMLCSCFGAFLYSVLTVTFRANQNVTGLALTIFGTGFGNFFGEVLGRSVGGYATVSDGTKAIFNTGIPFLKDLPVVGKLLFSYNFMVYLGLAAALLMAFYLQKTRQGLALRAVGENPATADAAGINVTRYKYLSTCVGGAICGLGGLYIVMNGSAGVGGVWVHNCIGGKGWIAVALVIFATWSPKRAIVGSLVFGGLSVLRHYLPPFIPAQIYDIFPYIATVLVLIGVSFKKKRENQPPDSLGQAYFREER